MRRILSLLLVTANLGITAGVGVSLASSSSTLAAAGDVKAAFGNSHAVALGSDGLVYAWGSLIPGATGSGSKDSLSRPTLVPIPDTRTSVDVASTYNSSAAVASDGSVWAWGTLGLGLGDTDGTTGSRYLSPVRVEFPAGVEVRKVSGACESYLALDSSGEVWQWGNFYGVWNQSYAQPRKVEGITGATSVTRGCSTSFAILADGSAKAWGSNGGGTIGDGTTTDRSAAVSVRLPGSRSFSSISVSSSHSLGLATDGTLWGWGGNSRGELGADANAVEYSVSPRQIVLSSGTGTITAIAASENSPGSVVVTSTNQVWEWGTWGQMGFVQNRRTLPSDIGSTVLRSVALGSGAAIFAGNDGSLWARGGWGQADLDGNCGATASDYPMWMNGQTLPARSLVRVRSNGQFGSIKTEDRLSFARIDSGAGGSLPMDGSGTVPGSVGTQLTVIGTSPTSSCYNTSDLTYSFSGDGGSTWIESANIAISTNSFGQTVVTASYTPSVSGRSRGLLKVSNPDGQSESYRFWLGIAAVVSTEPVEGGQTTLPVIVSASYLSGATSVGIGTDGLLYAWGSSEVITGAVGSQANPKKLVTPNGVTFVDVSVEMTSGSAAAAAVGSDGKIYVWGSGGADYIQGGTSSNAAPTPLTMPAGVSARQVQLTSFSGNSCVGASCVSVSGFIGVFVTTAGQVYGWGGGTESTIPNYGRGGTPVVEPSLAGFNIDVLSKPSSYMNGVSFLLHAGTDIYQWSVYRTTVCSGSCTYVSAAPALRVGATKKIVQSNSMSEMRWKVSGVLEMHQCNNYSTPASCTTSYVVSLPGSREVKDIGTNGSEGLVLATDGTLWSIWSGSRTFDRIPLPVALAGVSRFTGRASLYVVGAGGSVWRTPSRWGGGSIPSGTCAKRSQNDGIYYDPVERRVTSTSSLEFGPEWSEDGFALGIDSPSVPNSGAYYVESPQSAYYELYVTVRPAESIDLYAYFKSNCAGVTGLSTTWDLDDDGDFETTSAVDSVEAGTTRLTTPRQRTNADESDYEGLDATFVQSKVTLSASSPGGAMTGGGGRFVGVKLTSAYGSSSYRFALVARPEKLTGRIGVSINSAARFTDSADVDLSMVWPEGATTAIISNDGSFADAQEIPVAPSVRWRLPSEGTGYLPTTVYVRFKNLSSNGQGSWDTGEGDINYTDDIVLDLSPPEVSAVSAASTSTVRSVSLSSVSTMTVTQKATVTLSAFDGASGIASMQVTSDPAVPGPERVFSRQITIPIDRGSVAVRVKDNIGLWSPWSFARVSGFVAQQPETPTPPNTPSTPDTPTPPNTPSVPSTPTAPGAGSGRSESPVSVPSPQKESITTSPVVTAPAVVAVKPAFSVKLPSANIGASIPRGTATVASKVVPSAKTAARAPVTTVKTTQAVKPSVSGLAKNTRVAATITIGGKKVNLGSLKTSSLGRVTLPAMHIKAKGTYVVTLKVAGKTTYIKIKVR